ncbi:VanZ family protein [Pseudactinotalea terrae]|uniref:VanZ family protein n=1 Tax=Pseudactinotalea terrae TaxID=1743262 RepID=UPI0012E14B1C|nr:VanZ family protein [Pseudactinotalea terrae]
MSTTEAVTRSPRRILRDAVVWGALGLAVASNLWGLYAQGQPGPAMFPGFDKVAHLGSFAFLMLTGLLAGFRPRPLALVLAAHAALSEVVQHTLLPARSGDVTDLVADMAGVALGWLAWRAITWCRSRGAR